LEEFKIAYQSGKLALSLLNRVHNQEAACPRLGFGFTNLTWRKDQLGKMRGRLFEAGANGLSRGDVLYGPFCIAQSIAIYILLGDNLGILGKRVRHYYKQLFDIV
jgi:hypothetical protein